MATEAGLIGRKRVLDSTALYDAVATQDTVTMIRSCAKCTESNAGRTVRVHPKHRILDRARKRQRDPDWKARYRATRPKV